MRILVTGGSGSVGRELVPALLAGGDEVTVLDRDVPAGPAPPAPGLRLVRGGIEERGAVEEAMAGSEAVVHLAWSFSDDPAVLLERDLRGEQLLLEVARARSVRHVVVASSAIVYGRPARLPVDEDHPLRPLEARKPAYAVAKEAAERLALLAGRLGGPAATVLRFWWAFGEEIAGRHLRDLLCAAAAGRPLRVPEACGGSFLSIEDLAGALRAILGDARSFGATFNLASAYASWAEIARMAVDATGARGEVEVVPAAAFDGPAFLADRWELDDGRLRSRMEWRPRRPPEGVRALLRRAVANTWRRMAPADERASARAR